MKKLETIGLTPTDIHHIEYLSDRAVLQNLEGGFRWLKRNNKADAVAYFKAFAAMLETQLLSHATETINSAFYAEPVFVDR
jgi:hypothetical protein